MNDLARATCVILLATACSCTAGPAQPISSALFANPTPCGPPTDSMAVMGQWFFDPASGVIHAKNWEFHDDDIPMTINGIVQSITFDGSPASNIVAFTVLATVINNLPSAYQPGVSSNSHNEVRESAGVNYGGMLRQTRISTEFAIANTSLLPSGNPPYYLDPVSGNTYRIEALNEQELGWYCWTPGDPQFQPQGTYQVPTWVLGDIAPNASASVLMSFIISGGVMPKSDYRHSVIRASRDFGMDVFYNRHTSLKISHWLDTLLVDYGGYIGAPPGQYEEPPAEYVYASDVSVFFERDLDFGDAPDAPYPTLLVNDGARHQVPSALYLGPNPPDLEPDGQPSAQALGDDTVGAADEDGILSADALVWGSNATLRIVASTNGILNAWIDFDQNGNWGDPGDQIASDVPMAAGTNALVVSVPAGSGVGPAFGRFRFSSYWGLAPTGMAYDGEVEDHVFTLYQPAPAGAIAITNIACCASNNTVTFRWNGQTPTVYEPQSAAALTTNTAWTPLGGFVTSPPYEQSETMTTQRFYRIRAPYAAP